MSLQWLEHLKTLLKDLEPDLRTTKFGMLQLQNIYDHIQEEEKRERSVLLANSDRDWPHYKDRAKTEEGKL